MQLGSWEHAIKDAAAAIDKHLLNTVFTKYSFVKHCNALKRYLLLGQGDFIQTLMDLVGPNLGKRAQDMSEYQLNGSLDAAIRASNAQFDDADVLDRLRVKLAKPTAMETGQAPSLYGQVHVCRCNCLIKASSACGSWQQYLIHANLFQHSSLRHHLEPILIWMTAGTYAELSMLNCLQHTIYCSMLSRQNITE